MELANRLDRLWAAIIDRGIFLVLAVATAIAIPALRGSSAAFLVGGAGVIASLAYVGYQVYLLSTFGQTIGKRQMGLKIVLVKDMTNGGFVTNVLLRVCVPVAVTILPVVGVLFGLADPLFIFRDDRRCVHDHIAGTCVVKA